MEIYYVFRQESRLRFVKVAIEEPTAITQPNSNLLMHNPREDIDDQLTRNAIKSFNYIMAVHTIIQTI